MVTGEDTEQGQLRRTLDNLRRRVGLTDSPARRRVGLDLVGREVVGGVGALAGLVTLWGDDARLAGRQLGEGYRRHLRRRPAVGAEEEGGQRRRATSRLMTSSSGCVRLTRLDCRSSRSATTES